MNSLSREPEMPSLEKIQNRPAHAQKVVQSIYRGYCCRVLGPRYRYKSHVLRKAGETLQQNSFYHIIYLRVSKVEAISEAVFFQSIWTYVVDSFPDARLPRLPAPEIGKALDFQHALLRLVTQSRQNLVVFVDDLEMIPPNLGALLLGVLRTVFLMRADAAGARFQAVVGGSLSLSQVALENASGFESVSDLVLVGDLDQEERTGLAHALCRKQDIRPDEAAITYLLNQTGGDPFLIEEVLDLACRPGISSLEKSDVEQAVAHFLERKPYRVLLTELRHIETDPDLLASCLMLMESGPLPGNRLPSDIERSPSAVELCGAFETDGEFFRIKPGIWQTVLKNHFRPSHVGGRYVIVGNWRKAIDYLSEAAATGDYEIRVELYAAVINAINASLSVEDAFNYLLGGLRALYPDNDPYVYQIRGYELHSVGQEAPTISMRETERSEIISFEGPEYSISVVGGQSRLLVPLRAGGRRARPLGLISLLPLANGSLHEQRDEIKQLVSFLQQVARAIFSRMELARTAQRAEQLRALNGVLTLMLHHRTARREKLLQLALAGVTHGWGLGFNRAVLFQPDASGQMLRGTLAIGHLSQEAAEKEWKAFPFDRQTLDEWLNTLFDSLPEKMDFHRPLAEKVSEIAVPLYPSTVHQLARSYHDRQPFLGNRPGVLQVLPAPVLSALRPPTPFALVPLHTGEQLVGVLYVDDKFAPAPLPAERFELLQTFATQAALIIENASAITEAQRQAENVRRLREQHFTLNTGLIHELRTSMSGVQDLVREVQLLARRGQDVDAPLLDLAEKARIMDEINSRVQDFNMPPFKPGLHRLQPVIETTLEAVAPEQPADVDVEFVPPATDPPIYLDRAWIELLLRNLLQNAFEAFPAGQPGTVQIGIDVAPNVVSVFVTDNGPGIAQEVTGRIFESGVSTKKRGRAFMRGMGLFYCRQVAHEHHGSLEVASEPGRGTTFTLRLPRQKQETFLS